jgi:putative ABC transport system substrate-binding protein
MNRRDLIAVLSGAAALPIAARGQQRERIRRVGVLMTLAADDPEGQARYTAFAQGLQEFGWSVGRNVRFDIRGVAGNGDRSRRYARELVALEPDVILAEGAFQVGSLQQATRTVPIVFVQVTDPVGGGLVATLARPGGNITGFTPFEFGISAKWVELLKQIAPRLTRAAVIRNPAAASGIGQLAAIQAVAPSLGVELRPVDVRDGREIERVIANFAREPNGGLIVLSSGSVATQRNLIIPLAAEHRLPAVYAARYWVTGGGLISYGPDTIDPYRRAAGYVDRILKGEKPADLPVQAPTKYELAINLKTAKAVGLDVPAQLLARADEVIE